MRLSLTYSILLVAAAMCSLAPIVAIAQQPEASPAVGSQPPAPTQRPAPIVRRTPAETCVDVAITRPPPAYPRNAFERHLRGWTDVSFALDGSGAATDIQV